MKRFYHEVAVEPADGGWRVTLDRRPIRTQQGKAQVVPTPALADALAAEWRDQGETIDTSAFAMRDMVDYAIDVVADDREATIAKLLAFAETDTLCYRADPDEPLHRRQLALWEPLMRALEAREGVALQRISGVVHRPQPADTMAALRRRLESLDIFALAALQGATSLAASLCVGLAALEEGCDAAALWEAANLEEIWQAELWGIDAEAEARLARRRGEFIAAIDFARLSRPSAG